MNAAPTPPDTALAAAPPLDEPPQGAGACLNCGAALARPRPAYCGACGQETNLRPPTLMDFIQQFGGRYIAAEGALWRTLALLLWHPGRLTREYLAGRRRRYVLPLRLYLTISVVVFLALRWTGGADLPLASSVATPGTASGPSFTILMDGDKRVRVVDGRFECAGLRTEWCDRLRERFDLDPKSVRRELQQVPGRFVTHWATAMFVLLAIFALLQKAAWWNRGMRWSEHLVFGLHVHAFWYLLVLPGLVGGPPLRALGAMAAPVYGIVAAHTVYGGGWWATAARAAVVAFLYLVVMMTAVVGVMAWSLVG